MYIYLYICKNRIAAAVLRYCTLLKSHIRFSVTVKRLFKYRIYSAVLCWVFPVFVYEMLIV